MLFLTKIQENFLPIVKNFLVLLTVLSIVLLVIYLVSIYLHSRKKRFCTQQAPLWHDMINSLWAGEITLDDLHIPCKKCKHFKDILIADFYDAPLPEKNKIGKLYRRLGFFDKDVRQLKSRIWWKKIQAIERLHGLALSGAEDAVFPLLQDKRSEVRFSALRMLASTGSKKLINLLPRIFADNTRWAYRFLVNELFLARIPAVNLKWLTLSPDRDLRKAAAILLGRQGHKEAIPMLENLVNDDVKDVRREAVRSLGRINLAEMIPVLEKKVNDAQPQVRVAVAKSLSELKDLSALPLLEKLALDPDFEVRFQAFSALARFGSPGANIIKKYEVKYPEMVKEFLAGAK